MLHGAETGCRGNFRIIPLARPAVAGAGSEQLSGCSDMPIGLLTLEIHIPDARSLKDKRQVLRSLKDRLRGHFNVAVAELDHQDVWQRALVGVVSLSND